MFIFSFKLKKIVFILCKTKEYFLWRNVFPIFSFFILSFHKENNFVWNIFMKMMEWKHLFFMWYFFFFVSFIWIHFKIKLIFQEKKLKTRIYWKSLRWIWDCFLYNCLETIKKKLYSTFIGYEYLGEFCQRFIVIHFVLDRLFFFLVFFFFFVHDRHLLTDLLTHWETPIKLDWLIDLNGMSIHLGILYA